MFDRLYVPLFLSGWLIAACAGPGGGNSGGDAFVAPTATCSDGVQNQDESGVDCGGATCDACGVGGTCGDDSDCSTGFCDNGQCAVGQCGNGVQDPSEEGVDCGGTCPACLGATCGANGDCASGYCDNGACATPSCVDGITNGTETAVDCGGDCPACDDGSACSADTDCTSGFCDSGTCGAPPATCLDGETNGNETGEDCGGPDCPACPPGSGCAAPTDCASGQCVGGQCEALATCGDGMKNGTESDVDCGGGGCEPCASDKECGDNSDCLSNECVFGQCITPLCNDGMANGDETDVDCGGTCPGCGEGKLCDGNSDCESNVCEGGSCAPAPTCADGSLNGQETDQDCGGPECDPCGLDAACAEDDDCLDADCINGLCKEPTCTDGVLNQDELGTDCGGSCDPCETDGPCDGPSDCVSGVCTDNICVAATCSDGVLNQGEIDADCGGPNCPLCDIGAACATSPACSSGVCDEGVCILDFVQVTSADARFCGITTHDGSIRCWGDSDPGWAAPPAGTGYIHVAMGVTAPFDQTSEANKICALDAAGLATCNFETALPLDVPFTQLVIGTVEGGFTCGMFAETTTDHVAGGIRCWGTAGDINSYPFDPYEAFEWMSSPTHRWQVFAQKANGDISGEGYDSLYFAILDAASGPFMPGSLSTSRFRVGAVFDPQDGGYQPAYESSGASPPLTPTVPDDGAVVFGDSQNIDPTSFRVGHYDVALNGSTSELVISGPLTVPDPVDVPTGPVSHLWHGEWHTCTKHGEGTPLTCWGLNAFGDPTPPTQ